MLWELYGNDPIRIKLTAEVKEDGVRAGGDSFSPVLMIRFLWEEVVDDTGRRNGARDAVLAVGIALFKSGTRADAAQLYTGLLPITAHNELPLMIDHGLIEMLSQSAEDSPDQEMCIPISLSALVSSRDSAGVKLYRTKGPEVLRIGPVKWSRFLETWGYPATRYLPVSLALPTMLREFNEEADRLWGTAVTALRSAHTMWNRQDINGAGGELRRAIQFSIRTWDILWDASQGNEEDSTASLIKRIGQGIPTYNPDKYDITAKHRPDVQRAFYRLTLLRNLNALAHPVHHTGDQPLYARGDIDTLLTTVTAVLRGLPGFWLEHPSRMTGSSLDSGDSPIP